MTKKITPDDAEFWTERGIDFYVRHARPYQRYTAADDTPVKDAYALLKTAGQKAKMVAWAHQSDGILINRHAALPGLPPFSRRCGRTRRSGPASRRGTGTGVAIRRRTIGGTRGWIPTRRPVKHTSGSTTRGATARRSTSTTTWRNTSFRRPRLGRKSRRCTPTTSHTGCPPIAPSAISTQMLWRPKRGADGTSRSIMAVWT